MPNERSSVQSPSSTGPAGPSFEVHVAAACLTLLLTRGAPPFLGAGTIHSVHLQAGHLGQGWNTDDILIEALSPIGGSMKAAIQVKRTFVLSADEDSESIGVIRGAYRDFQNVNQFDKRKDVVALITSTLSAKQTRALRTLLDCARASCSAADMACRLQIPRYLGKPTRECYDLICKILAGLADGAPTDDDVWRFLCCFHTTDLDLNTPNGFTESSMRTLLAATLSDNDAGQADASWNKLVALALGGAGIAKSYTRDGLPSDLLKRHGQSTGFSTGLGRLLEDTDVVIGGVRTTLTGGLRIPRSALFQELTEAVENFSLIFVTGSAGSGKSALVKTLVSSDSHNSVSLAFRAVSLSGDHINGVLEGHGLTLNGLKAQTAMHGRKVLWVDAVERLMERPPEMRAAFLDLLRGLKEDPSWRIVVTCRDYSAETVQSAFFDDLNIAQTTVRIGELSDDELNWIAQSSKILSQPLANPTLRNLLRNPFFLDLAEKMNWQNIEAMPTTEWAFREKVWRDVVMKIEEDLEIGLPQVRDIVLREVALRRAKALEAFIEASDLNSKALARLTRDGILESPSLGSKFYAPAHDVFEDWALIHWLDDEFKKHERSLERLLQSIGTYPALRRAYRRWLTEMLEANPADSGPMIVSLIRNTEIAAHWREDSLVGVLQSKVASEFLEDNESELKTHDAALLRTVIHLLRVACRYSLPHRDLGIDADGAIFLPKGNGWFGIVPIMDRALPLFGESDFLLITGFLEEWILFVRLGIHYPIHSSAIANIAWHMLPHSRWPRGRGKSVQRLLHVITMIPLADKDRLQAAVADGIFEDRGYYADELTSIFFSFFYSDALFRDMPDLSFKVAGHVLGLDFSLDEIVESNRRGHGDDVEDVFGLGMRHFLRQFSSSAYQGPYLRMLMHYPQRGIEFIVKFINRACDAYADPRNRRPYIEPPSWVVFRLPDGDHRQHASWRLWAAYRAMQVAPHAFESALMALEYWLLETAKKEQPNMDSMLIDLLKSSNNAAITAVVTSIVVANPTVTSETALCLLGCRAFVVADSDRSTQEQFNGLMRGFGAAWAGVEEKAFMKERAVSAQLEHRRRNLEHVAVTLQMMNGYKERVWSLIDNHKAALPPEDQQDEQTKLWRIQLHRIDIRNFEEKGKTEDGHILIGSIEPEPDLQALINEQAPIHRAFDVGISLLNWGVSVFEGKKSGEDWREQISKAREVVPKYAIEEIEKHARQGAAHIAAVCIRDHWGELSNDEQEWCVSVVCDAVEFDADTDDYFAIGARYPMEGSRPAAFIISALFEKKGSSLCHGRLIGALSKAVIHNVEETVTFAVRGIGKYLFKSNRLLALTCIQALITQATEARRLWLEQISGHRATMEWEAAEKAAVREELREFIKSGAEVYEDRIGEIDLAQRPGRSIAHHIFAITLENPRDPLALKIVRRCASELPKIWEINQRSQRDYSHGGEERFNPEMEHEYVDAICQFVVQLDPADGELLLEPIFGACSQFLENAAEVVKWLILRQHDHVPAQTLWRLWQRFADDFVVSVDPKSVDREHSSAGKMIIELFLGRDWKGVHDWRPLHGETGRVAGFFRRFPATEKGLECYSYYLAHLGTPALPDALADVGDKISEASAAILNEDAVFYLEEILTRLIYGGNSKIRSNGALRGKVIVILDALVAQGSSAAYKMRDDFLTPYPRGREMTD